MERLKRMKETLVDYVNGEFGDLSTVDTCELGEAVDMIKDLEEAIYYCTITKTMEGNSNSSCLDKLHHSRKLQMKDLEAYMQELSGDIAEIIRDASPEEKQLLQQKLLGLIERVK